MAPIFTAHPFSIAEMPAIDCVHHRFILRFQIQEVCPRILLSPRLEFSVPNYQVLFIAKVNNHINSLVESIQMARRFVVQLGPIAYGVPSGVVSIFTFSVVEADKTKTFPSFGVRVSVSVRLFLLTVDMRDGAAMG